MCHCDPCKWGGCKIRLPPSEMADHEKICKEKAEKWHAINNAGQKRAGSIVVEPLVDTSYNFEVFKKKYIKKLKRNGNL